MLPRLRAFLPFLTSTSLAGSRTMVTKTPLEPTLPTSIAGKEHRQTLPKGGELETFYGGNGCFWGTAHEFDKYYRSLPGYSSEVGYTGGDISLGTPNYRQVCSGKTGHAEAVKVTFDPAEVSYAELVEFLFRTHDPTTVDQQGPDRGTQYRSAVFYTTPEQRDIAQKVKQEVQQKYFDPKGEQVVTQINEFKQWFSGEDYHQNYLEENPGGYTCPTHRVYW